MPPRFPAIYEETPPHRREGYDSTGDVLRQCASRLEATMASIARYGALEYTTWVPPRARVRKAVGSLLLLSNEVYRTKGIVSEKGERPSDVAAQVRELLWLDGRPLFWRDLWQALTERWRAWTTKRAGGV